MLLPWSSTASICLASLCFLNHLVTMLNKGCCCDLGCRAPGNAQLEDKCFTRLDGTHCYYFTTEDLSIRVEAAGFQTLKCSYACTLLRNRKQGLDMKRVFVHGEFKKGKPSYVSDSA